MSGEKAKMTKEIIESIETLSYESSDLSIHNYQEEFTKKLELYSFQQNELYNQKVLSFENALKKELIEKRRDIDFEIQGNLRKEKQKMYTAFEDELKDKLVAYLETSEYKGWIASVLSEYDDAIFMIDKRDESLFANKKYEIVKIPLGGFYVNKKNRVIDYTFESRFIKVMQSFMDSTKLTV